MNVERPKPIIHPQDSPELLYESVVRLMMDRIDKGILKPGDKLPSVRKLSHQLSISIATVVQAYSVLETQGIVEARPRSGFVVLAAKTVDIEQPEKTRPSLLSKKVSINDIVVLIAEVADDPNYVPLGAATLSPELSPIAELRKITLSTIRQTDEWGFFYEFVPGSQFLRDQLARQALKWQCNLAADDFVITNGAMEALQLALRTVAKPGDIIAVESPTFYPILQTLENLGMYALEIPTDPREGIDIDIFEVMISKEPVKACVLIPNFNNPLGYLMPEVNKRRLVELITKRQIPLIEDDIYGDLYFGPNRPAPLKAYDTEGLVLMCSSVSKTLSSGYRIGWIAPGRFLTDIKRLKYATNVAAPTLAQHIVAECFRTGLYDRHTAYLRRLFKAQMPYYLDTIAQYFPEGTRVTKPEGGFLFWVELPNAIDSLSLYKTVIEKGISIAPGPMFSAVGEYRHCIRLSGGHLWSPKIENTLETLGQLMHEEAKRS